MRFSKLFGIGLPRTGTTSLHQALNQIGISCIHFPMHLYTDANDLSVLSQYKAFTDAPMPMLYQKLDKAYPGSGFILTKRPVEPWLASMEWLLSEGRRIWQWKPEYDDYHQAFFGSLTFDADVYRKKYKTYHEDVLCYFAERDDFLMLDLAEGYGYEELCEFLEIPIHMLPYPRGNESRNARPLQKLALHFGRYNSRSEKGLRLFDHFLNRLQTHLTKH